MQLVLATAALPRGIMAPPTKVDPGIADGGLSDNDPILPLLPLALDLIVIVDIETSSGGPELIQVLQDRVRRVRGASR